MVVSKSAEAEKDPALLLEKIKNTLDNKSWLKSVSIIKGASMPVIKLECKEEMNLTRVDISVKDSRHKGLECVQIVRQYIKHYGALEKLLLVLKYIFKLGGLNDPYLVGRCYIRCIGRIKLLWPASANCGISSRQRKHKIRKYWQLTCGRHAILR